MQTTQTPLAASAVQVAVPQASVAARTTGPTTPVQATVTNLSTQIVGQAAGKTSRFDLQLDPLGLGRVDVSVQIDARGRASAALLFEKSDSANLLQTHVDALSDALTQAGLSVAPGAISFTHARTDEVASFQSAAQTTSASSSPDQAAQTPNPSFSLAGQNQGQGGAGQGGQERPGPQPSFGDTRAFDAAASAADITDQQLAAYRTLRPRGVDIRI